MENKKNFNVGDRVKMLSPFSKIVLGTETGTVVKVNEKSCNVQIDGKGNTLQFKFDLIEKIND